MYTCHALGKGPGATHCAGIEAWKVSHLHAESGCHAESCRAGQRDPRSKDLGDKVGKNILKSWGLRAAGAAWHFLVHDE